MRKITEEAVPKRCCAAAGMARRRSPAPTARDPVSQVVLAHRDRSGELRFDDRARHHRAQTHRGADPHLAHHDPLTGLPNRRLFRDRLEQALALALRESYQVGVMIVDLDYFKEVNDTLGHLCG